MRKDHFSLKDLILSENEIDEIVDSFIDIPITERIGEDKDELDVIARLQYSKTIWGLIDWLPQLTKKYPKHKESVSFIQKQIERELKALKIKRPVGVSEKKDRN